jgi:hypothetical protein
MIMTHAPWLSSAKRCRVNDPSSQLFGDLIEHWKRRSANALERMHPTSSTRRELQLQRHCRGLARARRPARPPAGLSDRQSRKHRLFLGLREAQRDCRKLCAKCLERVAHALRRQHRVEDKADVRLDVVLWPKVHLTLRPFFSRGA